MPTRPETTAALRDAAVRAAESVMPLVGLGSKHDINRAAVCAIRHVLGHRQDFNGTVVIGEGEKDQAPMLYTGEKLGRTNHELPLDIAVDPVECTTNAALGKGGSYVIIGAGPNGSLMPWVVPYMDKLAVGPEAADLMKADMINIDGEPEDTLRQVAKAMGKKPKQLVVSILDRERNRPYIHAARKLGVDLRLLSGGDLEQGILTSYGDTPPVDVLMGIGRAPEGVLQAMAQRCLGNFAIQGRLYAAAGDQVALNKIAEHDYKPNQVLSIDDMVGTDPLSIVAVGITDGQWLKGGSHGDDGRWHAGQILQLTHG